MYCVNYVLIIILTSVDMSLWEKKKKNKKVYVCRIFRASLIDATYRKNFIGLKILHWLATDKLSHHIL